MEKLQSHYLQYFRKLLNVSYSKNKIDMNSIAYLTLLFLFHLFLDLLTHTTFFFIKQLLTHNLLVSTSRFSILVRITTLFVKRRVDGKEVNLPPEKAFSSHVGAGNQTHDRQCEYWPFRYRYADASPQSHSPVFRLLLSDVD